MTGYFFFFSWTEVISLTCLLKLFPETHPFKSTVRGKSPASLYTELNMTCYGNHARSSYLQHQQENTWCPKAPERVQAKINTPRSPAAQFRPTFYYKTFKISPFISIKWEMFRTDAFFNGDSIGIHKSVPNGGPNSFAARRDQNAGNGASELHFQ